MGSKTRWIEVLQNHAVRIISFSTFNITLNLLYWNLSLLKFSDMISSYNIIFLLNIFYKTLPDSILNTFNINFFHSHHTRAGEKGFLNLPHVHSTAFGKKSIKFLAINSWNNLQNSLPFKISNKNTIEMKTILHKHFINSIKANYIFKLHLLSFLSIVALC